MATREREVTKFRVGDVPFFGDEHHGVTVPLRDFVPGDRIHFEVPMGGRLSEMIRRQCPHMWVPFEICSCDVLNDGNGTGEVIRIASVIELPEELLLWGNPREYICFKNRFEAEHLRPGQRLMTVREAFCLFGANTHIQGQHFVLDHFFSGRREGDRIIYFEQNPVQNSPQPDLQFDRVPRGSSILISATA